MILLNTGNWTQMYLICIQELGITGRELPMLYCAGITENYCYKSKPRVNRIIISGTRKKIKATYPNAQALFLHDK